MEGKYEGKDTACRALTRLIAKHLLLSEYLLDPAHKSEFSLKPLLSNPVPLIASSLSLSGGLCYHSALSGEGYLQPVLIFQLLWFWGIPCAYLAQSVQRPTPHHWSSRCNVHYPPWLTH